MPLRRIWTGLRQAVSGSAGPDIEPKQVCGRAVSLIDLLPTLAECCGLPNREAWQGRSLVSLLKQPALEWNHPASTSYEGNNAAVQTERFRYIHYIDGSEELYDHEKDLNEWNNLAENPEYTAVKAKLKKYLPKEYTERLPGKKQKQMRKNEQRSKHAAAMR